MKRGRQKLAKRQSREDRRVHRTLAELDDANTCAVCDQWPCDNCGCCRCQGCDCHDECHGCKNDYCECTCDDPDAGPEYDAANDPMPCARCGGVGADCRCAELADEYEQDDDERFNDEQETVTR